jgi:hypothetical protein
VLSYTTYVSYVVKKLVLKKLDNKRKSLLCKLFFCTYSIIPPLRKIIKVWLKSAAPRV